MEESEVKAEIGLCGGFPLQVIVAQLIALETAGERLTAIRASDVIAGAVALATEASLTVVALVEGVAGDVRDFLVTRLSPRGTELQVVEPIDVFHEFLFAHAPTSADGWEDTIAVIPTEAAGTITTHGEACQITIVVGVVDLAEEGDKRVALTTAVGF